MRVRNVLVFPAGTEIGQEIHAALKSAREVRLFGAGQDISTHARFSYPEYHALPGVHESGWLEQLCALCEKLAIDYIFPAHDDVIAALAGVRDRIPATVISPSSQTCEITRSKTATCRALGAVVRTPRLYGGPGEINAYPVLVKPDRGQGSAGVTKVTHPDDLAAAMANIAEPIIC
jgi:hypothetical protein